MPVVWTKLLFNKFTLGVVVIVAVVWVLQDLHNRAYAHGVADEKARQEKALAKATHDMRARHEQELKARGWQDAVEATEARVINDDLKNRLAELAAMPPKTLIKTKVVPNESGCSCPDPSLGDAFWLRYCAAGSDSGAADPAAACSVPTAMR